MAAQQVAELASWLKPDGALFERRAPEDLPKRAAAIGALPRLGARDEGMVMCTSGTTGYPKPVALPAESVCINAATIGAALGLGADDRLAVSTPLGYMYGLMGGCMAGLWAGATICLFPPRDPLTQLQAAIRRFGITVVQGPPSLLRLFMAYWSGQPFPSVRMVTTGGETLGAGLIDSLEQAFPSARKLFLYGMTEAGPRIAHRSFELGGGRDGRFGQPYSHIEWRIDPIGEPGVDADAGRLAIRGPTVFLGYIGPAGLYEGLDADGFFRTPDLVSRERDGGLAFRGRADRLFKSAGKLVNPEAVEAVLAMHPAIEDAYCFPESHEILGLTPVAELVAKQGIEIDRESLLHLCREHLEAHAIPRRWSYVSARALSDSGKQRRAAGPAGCAASQERPLPT
jgi:long-chain acyl-CoA synthetase